jgi:outer membrane protein, heavy metal efflux system
VLLRRSDLLSMQDAIASMGYNREYMSSFRNPDFGIRVEHMQMFGMPNEYSIMGMVTIPIAPWSSGMYTSDVQSMEYEIEAMTRERESMQLMAKRMLSEKFTMLTNEQIRLKNYENGILPAYTKAFESGLLAYRQNTGNFFVLLDAWEMLLMKRIEYYDVYLQTLRLQADYEYEIEQK